MRLRDRKHFRKARLEYGKKKKQVVSCHPEVTRTSPTAACSVLSSRTDPCVFRTDKSVLSISVPYMKQTSPETSHFSESLRIDVPSVSSIKVSNADRSSSCTVTDRSAGQEDLPAADQVHLSSMCGGGLVSHPVPGKRPSRCSCGDGSAEPGLCPLHHITLPKLSIPSDPTHTAWMSQYCSQAAALSTGHHT